MSYQSHDSTTCAYMPKIKCCGMIHQIDILDEMLTIFDEHDHHVILIGTHAIRWMGVVIFIVNEVSICLSNQAIHCLNTFIRIATF